MARLWLRKRIRVRIPYLYVPYGDHSDYLSKKSDAMTFVQKRIAFFNKSNDFKFNRITIKNTSTRWGSCSHKRNLNFSYKILTLPLELADYIIVHELCHLIEFNHSKRFWMQVKKIIPDYKERRGRLQIKI